MAIRQVWSFMGLWRGLGYFRIAFSTCGGVPCAFARNFRVLLPRSSVSSLLCALLYFHYVAPMARLANFYVLF
ncbi:hypothetical protein EDB87DRAFT_1592213 [Lactarius vividus]|nr:hypothetical protein EDB87DRAFT_1592213 [Lactarius vividus]